MGAFPLLLAEDRGFAVPPGATVSTGYVDIHRVRIACRARMAVGDVDRAYQRLLQTAPAQPWPPPTGRWDGETFVLVDGRHAFVAALMIGFDAILVAWVEVPGAGASVLPSLGPLKH